MTNDEPILKDLRKIGLTKGEIQVYEALLALGDSTKTNLARRSRVAPANIYDITNRLTEKGLISRIEKNGVAHFSPAHPNNLLTFIEDKQKEIEKEKELVTSLIPSILSRLNLRKEQTLVEAFQGWNGMKTVFNEILDECSDGDRNYIFGASKGEAEEQADRFFLKFSEKRARKGIITHIIFNKDVLKRVDRIRFFLISRKYKVKFITQVTPAEVLLYKNRTCIVILTKEPLVIRITSQAVADSFKQYFEVLWKTAVSPIELKIK